MPKQVVFALVTFLHDLFTVVWVGGMITLALAVLPSVRQVLGMGPETRKLMDAIQRRLRVFVYVSIVGLLLTGLLLSRRSAAFQGLFHFGNAYSAVLSVKHVLTVLMIGVALGRSRILGETGKPPDAARGKLKAGLLLLNVVLGVAVLLLSGFSAALSSGGSPPA